MMLPRRDKSLRIFWEPPMWMWYGAGRLFLWPLERLMALRQWLESWKQIKYVYAGPDASDSPGDCECTAEPWQEIKSAGDR